MNLNDFEALTFDCYGTLIDWEVGIVHELHPWVTKNGLEITGDEVLSLFSKIEPQIEREHPRAPYTEILRMVFNAFAQRLGIDPHDDESDHFATSVGRWPVFPDTCEALQRLKQRFKLIIVSNVDHTSFNRSQRRLECEFDAVITAQDIGVYKPDPRMLEAGIDAARRLGVSRDKVLHTAQSLYHDHVPAKKLGLATCWIDRHKGKGGGATRPPGIDVAPNFTFTSLAEMADAVEGATLEHN